MDARTKAELEAELRSFGVDLLALAERYGVDHISASCIMHDDDPAFVSGIAWSGDDTVASTSWFIEEDADND